MAPDRVNAVTPNGAWARLDLGNRVADPSALRFTFRSLCALGSPMNELVVQATTCVHCGEPLPHGAEVCPDCDSHELATLAPPSANGRPPLPAQRGAVVGLACFDNRWLVVGLLLVAGPLGLPALWLSRRFSLAVKIATTALYTALTVALPIALVWYWCEAAVRPVVDALVK